MDQRGPGQERPTIEIKINKNRKIKKVPFGSSVTIEATLTTAQVGYSPQRFKSYRFCCVSLTRKWLSSKRTRTPKPAKSLLLVAARSARSGAAAVEARPAAPGSAAAGGTARFRTTSRPRCARLLWGVISHRVPAFRAGGRPAGGTGTSATPTPR